jgi:hypothetical protein
MLDVFTGFLGAAEPIALAAGGFLMKYVAQSQAYAAENHRMALEGLGARTSAADAADKRGGSGGAWIRRFIVTTTFLSVFGCIIYVAVTQGQTSHVYVKPVKTWMFGLIETGGKMKSITTQGYTITPEMWRILLDITFFYFGAGVAKTRK